jgi:hypothetical protein
MLLKYALSEADGLRYRFPEESSHRLYPKFHLYSGQMYPRSALEANQINYTCRQLRHRPKVWPSGSTISPSCVPRSTFHARLAKSEHSALVSASAA